MILDRKVVPEREKSKAEIFLKTVVDGNLALYLKKDQIKPECHPPCNTSVISASQNKALLGFFLQDRLPIND